MASRYGVLAYNFFREYAEEFFDLEEVVHSVSARWSTPDWIFDLPPVASMEREMASGRAELSTTGFCLLPRHGIISISLLALIKTPEIFEHLQGQVRGNWEAVAGGSEAPPIEFVRLDDRRLDEWVQVGQLGTGSALAVDRARTILLNRSHSPRATS